MFCRSIAVVNYKAHRYEVAEGLSLDGADRADSSHIACELTLSGPTVLASAEKLDTYSAREMCPA